ncbi:MAG: TPM domain-containing protein [Firmicutes bacterium]|nr:TPM domain-containing protein [Bacillota bacterium]
MNKKNILKLLILVLLLTFFPKIAFAQENLIKKAHVNDYADILEDDDEKELTKTIKEYIEKYDLDIAVTTTNTSYFMTTKQFANKFYDQNNMGIGEDRNGILLVIDMQNREFYILTNGFVHQLINDSRIELVLDKMEPSMRDGDYNSAINSFLKEINKYYKYHKYGPPYLWIGAFIVAVIMAFVALSHEKKKLKLISDALNANNYFVDKEIENKIDKHTNTRTRVIHHPRSSSGGGSFSGGGSRGGGGRSF